MIKTIQYLALNAAFQNVLRRAMLHSIEQTDPALAAVLSRGCALSTSGFSAGNDRVLRFVLADLCRLLDAGAKLFANLDNWNLYIKPHCLNNARS